MQYVGRKALLCAFITISLALIGCGKQTQDLPTPNNNFVVETNGYDAVVLVSIPSSSGGRSLCTGTIVGPRVVLTAAHCLLTNGRYEVHTKKAVYSTYEKYYMGQGVVESTDDIGILVFSEEIADPSKDKIYAIADHVRAGDQLRLVGYGCSNLRTRTGAGQKRTGTNEVAAVSDFVDFVTPKTSSNSIKGILGPENRAGSCFGDSGGPALRAIGTDSASGEFEVAAVTHAGGFSGDEIISEYVNVSTNSRNRAGLRQFAATAGVEIKGL